MEGLETRRFQKYMSGKIDNKIETCLYGVGAATALCVLMGKISYDFVINRNRKKTIPLLNRFTEEDDVISGTFKKSEVAEKTLSWAEETKITQYDIVAYDGIPLHAYGFIQSSKSHLWLIAAPAYTQSAASLFPVAEEFYKEGYNTLLLEQRGVGKSGGQFFGMGWIDRFDVKSWIQKVLDTDSNAQIVLFGLSTGADAVMMAAGEELKPNVRCVIGDSGYSELLDLINYRIKSKGFPCFPLNFSLSAYMWWKAGYSLRSGSAVSQVTKSKTPILFIHGGQDKVIPSEMTYELYNAASCPKDLLVIPQADHLFAMYVDPEQYWKKVWTFVDRFITKDEITSEQGSVLKRITRLTKKALSSD